MILLFTEQVTTEIKRLTLSISNVALVIVVARTRLSSATSAVFDILHITQFLSISNQAIFQL